MKKFILALLVMVSATEAHAAPNFLKRMFQDIKLPSQQVLEKDVFSSPLAQDTARILSHVAGPTSAAAAAVTTFSNQPDMARNLIVTAEINGPAADLGNCLVNVAGTDIRGRNISENFDVRAATFSAVTGNFAFKTVTSVNFPLSCEAGGFSVKWNIGIGVKLGLKSCQNGSGDLAWTSTGGIYDATRATVATGGSTSVQGSTISFNLAPNGVSVYNAYYVNNFRCP